MEEWKGKISGAGVDSELDWDLGVERVERVERDSI